MDSQKKLIKELEERLSELPHGYISNKMIYGRNRKYLQWTEDGRKKSRYLDDDTAMVVAEKIEERRRLQKELRTARVLDELSGSRKKQDNKEKVVFKTTVITGTLLKDFIRQSESFKSRQCLGTISSYLDESAPSKVLILYGLRRTGKTTLIQQAIRSIDKVGFSKAAFIQIRPDNSLADLNNDMKVLQKRGYRYVFIDEITFMPDFIQGAALLSDIYVSSGIHIILSGTDSLGFIFTSDEQLYDRCILVHTTFIPYREFESVLGIMGIDKYIRYGGTMSRGGLDYNSGTIFSSASRASEYVDSAIARNIQHSLRYYQYAGHFRHLEDLFENNELTSAINRVVEDINHRFTIEVLVKDFQSNDFGISVRNLRNDRTDPTDILDKVDYQNFVKGLMERLEIINRNSQCVEITQAHRIEIKEYLDLLDLTVDIPVDTIPVRSDKVYQTVLSQPGLRFAQAQAFLRQLLQDQAFQSLSAVMRRRVSDRIMSEIEGRMMEEIVLLETQKARSRESVFKLKFAVGEFDMVVADLENDTCELYEIKHSCQAVAQQYRHLKDEEKCSQVEFRFGQITRKTVIYRGETVKDGDIEFVNVEEYLKDLVRYL